MIGLTAATGRLGRLVIAELLQRVPPDRVVARARDPNEASDLAAQGITVRLAHYDDPARLDAALRGIQRLLLISGSEVGRRVQQHRNVIATAVRASSFSPTRASSTPTVRRSASWLTSTRRPSTPCRRAVFPGSSCATAGIPRTARNAPVTRRPSANSSVRLAQHACHPHPAPTMRSPPQLCSLETGTLGRSTNWLVMKPGRLLIWPRPSARWSGGPSPCAKPALRSTVPSFSQEARPNPSLTCS